MAEVTKAKGPIRTRRELIVYQRAFDIATRVFLASRKFPKEERYSLTDQVRRSSRSVTSNIAEAWRKRRYEAAFVSKLNDAEGEAAETQVWIEHAVKAEYIEKREARELYRECDVVLRMLVAMSFQSEKWCTLRGS
jgi:four helix bundle protein